MCQDKRRSRLLANTEGVCQDTNFQFELATAKGSCQSIPLNLFAR